MAENKQLKNKPSNTNQLTTSTFKLAKLQSHSFLNLKLVSAIFYQLFTFSPNDTLSKTIKNVFNFIEKVPFVLEILKFS